MLYFLAFVVVVVAAAFALRRSADKNEQAEAQAGAMEQLFAHCLSGSMTYEDHAKLAAAGFPQKFPGQFAALALLKQFQESVYAALHSRDPETARSRMAFAAQVHAQLRASHGATLGPTIMGQVDSILLDTQERHKTAVHLNAAELHTLHALTLKTSKAKARHLEKALAVIDAGIAEGTGDIAALNAEREAVLRRMKQADA